MTSYPRTCVSCAHWGKANPDSNPHEATDRWRWCEAGGLKAWSHVGFVCDHHERLKPDAITERMQQWGITSPEDDQPEAA